MNDTQRQQLLNILLGASGPVASLLLQWGIQPTVVSQILQIALLVLPPAYAAWRSHKSGDDKSVIAAAANTPGVTSIQIAPTATDGAAKAAADPTLPTVNKTP
jgi:hypothetical protein